MAGEQHFSSVRFLNYKALKNFSVQLRQFNILVGPNNSGKSTILGAFRILAEGMRRARARKPELLRIAQVEEFGYRINLDALPISTENIFTNYDETNPARILFKLSDANELELVFPELGSCCLVCRPTGRAVRTPSMFKSTYPATLGFVPVLGPVDHEEPPYKEEAARKALLTHRASRNFRNIWYHYPDKFEDFQAWVRDTWPGMDINPPELVHDGDRPLLRMFCPEECVDRELYWAGFGFQVWCQMLTYVLWAKEKSLLVIDEPDIYLHSDVQRQLLNILYNLGPDIILATHSTEIIAEAEHGDILLINKKQRSAKRISDPDKIQHLFELLGSNLNPTLTQLAKSRRATFVEGKDFQILGAFARRLGVPEVAARRDFAVIPIEGFNPRRIEEYSRGIEFTLGTTILKSAILDRDYRPDRAVKAVIDELCGYVDLVHIHDRKEIENFLLECGPLERAIRTRLFEHNERTNQDLALDKDICELLCDLTDTIKHDVGGQFISRYVKDQKFLRSGVDSSTLTSEATAFFEESWSDFRSRMTLVPGKRVFSLLNTWLQNQFGISISPLFVIQQFKKNEVPQSIVQLITDLSSFRIRPVK